MERQGAHPCSDKGDTRECTLNGAPLRGRSAKESAGRATRSTRECIVGTTRGTRESIVGTRECIVGTTVGTTGGTGECIVRGCGECSVRGSGLGASFEPRRCSLAPPSPRGAGASPRRARLHGWLQGRPPLRRARGEPDTAAKPTAEPGDGRAPFDAQGPS